MGRFASANFIFLYGYPKRRLATCAPYRGVNLALRLTRSESATGCLPE